MLARQNRQLDKGQGAASCSERGLHGVWLSADVFNPEHQLDTCMHPDGSADDESDNELPSELDSTDEDATQGIAPLDATGEFPTVGLTRPESGPDLTVPLDSPGAVPVPSSVARKTQFGDYQLEGEIARGGMGIVYRARQSTLNRPVALKMILSGQLASDEEVRRFYTEAESAAKLDHPNIVPIYDIGQYGETHYFSMKLIEGSDLNKQLATLRNNLTEAVALLEKVCRAVAHAHERGILHRDLKPANILIDQEGEPFVTDLGLARGVEVENKLTRTGAIVGTPSYMSPEQAAGDSDLTMATDVYSLGTILYEILTGRPPFRGKTSMETLMQVLHDEPTKPSFSGATDRSLEMVALKCLAKDPSERYRSALDLAEDLRRWLNGEPIAIRSPSVSALARNWLRQNFGRASWILVVGLLGGLISGFGLWNATVQKDASSDLATIYEQLPSAEPPFVLFSWVTPDWMVLPSLILFVVSLGFLGFFTAWLVRTKNTSADVAAGLAVGIISAGAAFFCALATMSIAATSKNTDLNFLGLLGTAPLDETPPLILDQYPELEGVSRSDQIQLLKSKIMVDRTFGIPRGLTLATVACLSLFVVAGIAETVIAGRAIRKHDSWWQALSEYTFCSLPYVALSTFLGIHLAVILIFGRSGFVLDALAWIAPLAFAIAVVAELRKVRLAIRAPLTAIAAGMVVFFFLTDFPLLPDLASNRMALASAVEKAERFPENSRLKHSAANAYQALGVGPYNSGRYRFALSCFEEGIEYIDGIPPSQLSYDLHGIQGIAYSNAANALVRLGRRDEAIRLIHDGLAGAQPNPQMYRSAASFLLAQREQQEVDKLLSEFSLNSPTDLTSLIHLVLAKENFGIKLGTDEHDVALDRAVDFIGQTIQRNASVELAERLQDVPWEQQWQLILPGSQSAIARAQAALVQATSLDDLREAIDELQGAVANDLFETKAVRGVSPAPINLVRHFPEAGMHTSAFAVARVNASTAKRVSIALGSDDGFQLWVNGQSIGQSPRSRAFAERHDILEVLLTAGENLIVLRIDQNSGPWMFDLQIDDSDGWPAAVTWSVPQQP